MSIALIKPRVAVSVVSHGHGDLVWGLVDQLVNCSEVSQVIVTLNIPEAFPAARHARVTLVENPCPKGFGANHNAAFAQTDSEFYCVINPDIVLIDDPFATLLDESTQYCTGLIAPLVVGGNGASEDSMRCFLTPLSMVKRLLGLASDACSLYRGGSAFYPDWVAGMFMLFRSEAYEKVQGFDERYFMYCEDADICTRLWMAGYKIMGCPAVSVIHNAQRASHRSFKHFSWHVRSIARYFVRHAFSLPNKDAVIQRG